MNKKDISKYILRVFLRTLRQCLCAPLWLLSDFPIFLFGSVIWVFLSLLSLVVPICLPIVILVLFIKEVMAISPIVFFAEIYWVSKYIDYWKSHIEPYLNNIFDVFIKKLGIAQRIIPQIHTDKEEDEKISRFINKRMKLDGSMLRNMKPVIHKLYKMNSNARYYHETYLSDLFTEGEINEMIVTEYSDAQLENAIQSLKNIDLNDKIKLMKYLFMFAVLEDGIHKDEWYFLMGLLAKIRINSTYTEYLRNHFSSLRTEFDEEHKSSASSTGYQRKHLKSYYAILGLDETASDEEVKKAYHALALQHHPDLPKNAERIQECEEMMVKINEAHEKIIKLFRDEEKESGSGETHSENSATRKSNSHLKPYYEILGLDETASDAEIKKAYRALVSQYHPYLPKNANRIKECEEMMAKINEAYEKIRG